MPLPICTTRKGSGLLLGPEFGYATALKSVSPLLESRISGCADQSSQSAHPTFRQTLSRLSTDPRISSKDKLQEIVVAAFGWDEAFYLCYSTVKGRIRQSEDHSA